jgi:SAM-dependent methyltransferase
VDVPSLQKRFAAILKAVPPEVTNLYTTTCPLCGRAVKLVNAAWTGDELSRIKGHCPDDGTFTKDADSGDRTVYKRAEKLLAAYKKDKGFYYPADALFQFVRRNGKTRIDQLFSKRNLLLAAILLREINKVKDPTERDLLLLAFTSMLPNISSMIPADPKAVTGKSGWQISKFWVPTVHTEKNVIDSFTARFTVIEKAQLETRGLFSAADADVRIQSAENLDFIPDASVDYIFTDPPYGDSIAYLGLSMFWNAWLKYNVDYNAEIIYDSYRKKDEQEYSARLQNAFRECYRVLKPGKYMSFTFHTRHVKFWKIVIDAVLASGFELRDVIWQAQAVSSGTQGINRRNTLAGDFVYTFQKPKDPNNRLQLPDTEGETLTVQLMTKLLRKQAFVSTPEFYEQLIPLIVKRGAFLDLKGNILNIDKVLSKHFTYDVIVAGEDYFGWTKK